MAEIIMNMFTQTTDEFLASLQEHLSKLTPEELEAELIKAGMNSSESVTGYIMNPTYTQLLECLVATQKELDATNKELKKIKHDCFRKSYFD